MDRYENLGGNFGVDGYKIGSDYIVVQFISGKEYTYTYDSAGADNIEKMKSLARDGEGLNSFITHNVRKDYKK